MSTQRSGKSKKSKAKKVRPSRSPKASVAKVEVSGEIEFIARGLLTSGSKVLLCQNVKHGYLYLPGGHIEFAESARAALVREFLEECGVQVRVGSLALASEATFQTKKRWHHELNLVFHVEHAGKGDLKKVRSKEDGIAFVWVDLAAVPELDIRPLAVKAFLAASGGGLAGADWVSEIPD